MLILRCHLFSLLCAALTVSSSVLPPASCAGERSGRSAADVSGPGVGPAGVSDAAGPAGAGAAGAAGAEDAAGEGEAAGPERAAGMGPRRRTLPPPPQAGRETGEGPYWDSFSQQELTVCADRSRVQYLEFLC